MKNKYTFARLKKCILGIYRDIYKYIYICPKNLVPLIDESNDWFQTDNKIMHALGSIDNNIYTNSKEALDENLKLGIFLYEADVNKTKDNYFVLSHENVSNINLEDFLQNKIKQKYSPITLSYLFEQMRKNNKIYILLDIKNNHEIEVTNYIVEKASDIIDRFIIQIGTREKYKQICKIHKFKYFHWNFSIDGNVNYNLQFVVKNKIKSCSVSPKNIKNNKTLQYLNKYNVKVFSYTINSQTEFNILKQKGCYGIISDFVKNKTT